jgi:molybdopterin adenylyltransferase
VYPRGSVKKDIMTEARIIGISISQGGIPKFPRQEAVITTAGLMGDGHNHAKHNTPNQAVSLQDIELLEDVCREHGIALPCGTIGENLMVKGLHVQRMALGTQLQLAGGVILELTKVRQPCYVLDSIDPRLKQWMLGRCGMYAKVVREGVVRTGEAVKSAILSAF